MRARGRGRFRRDVHDRGVAGDRGVGHGEPALPLDGGLRPGRGRCASIRVPGHRGPGPLAADRRPRPRPRTPHAVRRRVRSPTSWRGSSSSSAPSTPHLVGIDPGRVRLHVCWGNYEGPHTLDVALEEILPLLYQANVGGLVVSMANPRHAHEYRCFERLPVARRHGPRGGRDRHHQQLRGAPRGGGGSNRPGGRGGRGPPTGHRRHRLWLRHLGGDR